MNKQIELSCDSYYEIKEPLAGNKKTGANPNFTQQTLDH